MRVDVGLGQDPEFRVVLGDYGHFDVGGLEIGREDGGQAVDGQLNGFVVVQVRLLLVLLFQEGISFGLLGPGRTGLECAVVASWIRLVQNRLISLDVVGDDNHCAAKRSHFGVLRVHLADVCDSLTEHIS